MHLTPAQQLWADRETVANAGLPIYVAHLSMPSFMAIEAAHGTRFHSPEALRASIDRTAGLIVCGIGLDPAHPISVVDSAVAAQLRAVGAITLPRWSMPFIASVLAAGPFLTSNRAYITADADYLAEFTALSAAMGMSLPAQAKLERWLNACLGRHAASTPDGRAGYALLAQLYLQRLAALSETPRIHPLLRSMAAQGLLDNSNG